MDAPCSCEDLQECLRDLALMNRLTRAHRPTMLWLESVLSPRSQNRDLGHPDSGAIKLVDVGCGYGDMLRRIERWAVGRGIAMELVGIDVNANAIRAAREATPEASKVRFVLGGACVCVEADVVTVSGVTHHLREEQIVQLLAWMERTARVGWIITDLHRKPLSYHVFSVLARGPWWHRFIRPDGMASIRRSFVEEDWARMCAAAGIDAGAVAIFTHRPARLCVSRRK